MVINRLSQIITTQLINDDCINRKDEELYNYAAYNLLLKCTQLSILLVISIILNAFTNMCLILIPFFLIRKYSGGYHAKSPLACSIITVSLITSATVISKSLYLNIPFIIATLISSFIIIILSPVDSITRCFSEFEVCIFRRKLKYTLAVILLVTTFGIIANCSILSNGCMLGIILASISVIVGKRSN